MRLPSYHTRRKLKKLLSGVLLTALVLLILWACWMVWLQRFLVYTQDGVYLDFDRPTQDLIFKETGPVEPDPTLHLDIHMIDPGDPQQLPAGSLPDTGVYIDVDLLSESMDELEAKIRQLEPRTAVLIDLKSSYGNYYYSTAMQYAEHSQAVDIAAVDRLLAALKEQDLHLIARVPAFQDSVFALNEWDCGLFMSSGALWPDEEGCYWLDPANPTVQGHLLQLCREFRELGFDEVVFTDFRIPDSGAIEYSAVESKEEILKECAQFLVTNGSGKNFTVSFYGSSTFPLPAGTSRLFLEQVPPDKLLTAVEKFPASTQSRLVFVTDTLDTRFDEFPVLRRLQLP